MVVPGWFGLVVTGYVALSCYKKVNPLQERANPLQKASNQLEERANQLHIILTR